MTLYKQINDTLVEMTPEEVAAFEEETARVTLEILTRSNLEKRARLLAETDWFVVRATETSTPMPEDVATYRQALRDITTHADWPNLTEEDWPVKPV